MFPYIINSSSITIGSYGVMLAIAYLTGRYLYIKRLNINSTKTINTELLIILLLVFGVIGAKLMFVLKNPTEISTQDFSNLIKGSGFSSQGAIIAAILVTIAFANLTKTKVSLLLDNAAFPAIVAYALARFGCFLAGDNCYGIETSLPWGMSFPNGIEPTHDKVHPVPLYEIAYSIGIAVLIHQYQKRDVADFSPFFLLLLTWGAARFLVEFVSINPPKILGMSGSQFGALLMFISGSIFFLRLNTKKKATTNG
ncbi:prolipoprotein diacylglyceryl transferase [Aliikangiella sp. G2MR2-5]|uniref:prolipoprotein diacylglyceryl transferase n=1 Tax=Aliikangiella sp. G2MR2-5 TaxID=2788943 RepID=UPI0018A92BF6|nr:prolipoprotein diacylglyceryl transferase family protein [Aliikangiella sp. G2MR2-5]